ncbi:MAG TPA: nucleotidyltransferase domain-containing protein, partial [Chloroflexota bacterium]|nr:nucleotidyltransferase domain-containing protein [Chloroflexota bacterium]
MEERFGRAVRRIVDDLSRDPEVTAVLFFGSVQRGEASADSDLDFYVATTGGDYWRSAREIGGVAAELFCNPVSRLRQMFENEDQIALNAFATGELVLDRHGEGQVLVDRAKRSWTAGPKPLSADVAARWRYRITALASDAEGLAKGSADARLVAGLLVPLALEGYCALNRVWADQPKPLIARVAETDADLAGMVASFYEHGM